MQPLGPERSETELAVKGLNSPGPGNSCGNHLGEALTGGSYLALVSWAVCVLEGNPQVQVAFQRAVYATHPLPTG